MDTSLADALAALLDPNHARDRASALLAHLTVPRRLAQLSAAQLAETRLVSHHEAARIAASFAVAREALRLPPRTPLDDPSLVASFFPELAWARHEELWAIPVDSRLLPLARERVAHGGPDRVVTSAADVLRAVLIAGGVGVFLVHNHPSGDPSPSDLDRRFTRQLSRAAREVGVVLHDHLVVAGSAWESALSAARGTAQAWAKAG